MDASGVIEATEVNLAPKISEKITWLCCRVGDRVKAGEAALRLDRTELLARVDEARASLKAAQESVKEAGVQLEDAKLSVDTADYEVDAAEAEVLRYKALAEEARKNFERAGGLIKDGFISKKAYDAARAAFDSTRARLNSAGAKRRAEEARLRNARVKVKMSRVRISTAKARAKKEEAALKVLLAQLDDTVVKSPIDGVVSYRAFEEGEVVGKGQAVYTVYDTSDIWARVDIEESRIGKIKLGAEADITPPGMKGTSFPARVFEIGELAGFATQKDVVRETHDIKTFKVKARVIKPSGILKPGMTVDVRIFYGK